MKGPVELYGLTPWPLSIFDGEGAGGDCSLRFENTATIIPATTQAVGRGSTGWLVCSLSGFADTWPLDERLQGSVIIGVRWVIGIAPAEDKEFGHPATWL